MDAIADIIYAHSDLKDENNKIVVETFIELLEKYKSCDSSQGENEDINVLLLAAILRLADELDISYKRIIGTGYKEKKNIPPSMWHYIICEYFDGVSCDKDNGKVLEIKVSVNSFKNAEAKGQDSTIAAMIIEKYDKICKEFDLVSSKVLANTHYASKEVWKIEKIKLEDEQKFRDCIKKKR